MQSDQTFIEKTFQLINQLTGHITFITIKVVYLSSTREINLSRAISDIHQQGFNLDKCMIFYLDYFKRLFVHVGTFPFPKGFELLLKFQLFLQTTIKLRFRKLSTPSSPKNQKKSIAMQSQQPNKPTRKQKTIQQVQQLVSLWRKYFQMTDQNGKKLYTLQNAALKLGIHKKTLDDYYYKLKTAQSLGFDFEKNKNEKIGLLRKFVKDNKMKKGTVGNGMPSSSVPSKNTQGSGFFSNNGGHYNSYGVGVAHGSYAHSYHHQPLPQKPPEDEIDKYFVKDSDSSSSSSDSQQSQ